MDKKKVICECCKTTIENKMGKPRYCISCGLFIKDLKQKVIYYKNKSEKLNIKLYGNKNGAERIRWRK